MFTKVADPGTATRTLADYLNIGDAADILGISPSTLRNWDNQRKLKTLRHPKNAYRMYRREDLEALLRHEGLRGRLYQRFTPQVDWNALGDSDHVVQFYDSDAFLADAVSRLLGAAVRAGDGAVLIATRSHRNAIQRKLQARGLNLSLARGQGQFVSLDAAETLARFMVDGLPDRRRFRDLIGGLLARTAEGRSRVRAFGEMVALLWNAGNQSAAIKLEGLWNELRIAHTFILQCAYPMGGFSAERHDTSFRNICACHSRVIPAESYAGLSTEEERLQAIARLQQKAQALGTEISRRKRVEGALRASRRHLPEPLRDLLAELE